MYFIIEYVETVTGIEGEALSWEFAKTADEATIQARAHFLLFKARFGAQGYRILSPVGLPLACGPAAPIGCIRFRRHRAAPEGRSCREASSLLHTRSTHWSAFRLGEFRPLQIHFGTGPKRHGTSHQSRCGVRRAGHWRADNAACPSACKKALMSERQQSLN